MLLNGQNIIEAGIIIPSEYSKVSQVGIDLSLAKVEKIKEGSHIYKDRTDINPDGFKTVEPGTFYDVETGRQLDAWKLKKGVYAITFNEGCNIPAEYTGTILHRSSLYRTGTIIVSPIWDPGYKTEKMGTVMIVNVDLFVEVNARVCQISFTENQLVTDLYNGQWQGGTTAWEKAKK